MYGQAGYIKCTEERVVCNKPQLFLIKDFTKPAYLTFSEKTITGNHKSYYFHLAISIHVYELTIYSRQLNTNWQNNVHEFYS